MLIMDKPLRTYPDGSHACGFGKGAVLVVHDCVLEQLTRILSDINPSIRKDAWFAYPFKVNFLSKVRSSGEFCIVHGNICEDTVWDTNGIWHTSLLTTHWVISCDRPLRGEESSYVSTVDHFYGAQFYKVHSLEAGEALRAVQSGAFLTVFGTSKEYPTQSDLRISCYMENRIYFLLHEARPCTWNAYAVAAKTCCSERNVEHQNLSRDSTIPGHVSGLCPDTYIEKLYGEGRTADQIAIMLCKMLTGGYACPDYGVDSIKSLVINMPEIEALKVITGASQVIKVRGNYQIGQRPLDTQPVTPRLTESSKVWKEVLISTIQRAKVSGRFTIGISDYVLEIGGRKYHIASEIYAKLFKPYV